MRAQTAGKVDPTFNTVSLGLVGGGVWMTATQTDGKVLVVGEFHGGVARLNADGTTDTTFAGQTNGFVYAVGVQTNGQIVIAGNFNEVNGVASGGNIARLNSDGSRDTTFDVVLNNDAYGLTIQSDGKILVGGYFTSINWVANNTFGSGTPNQIARLNTNGSLDTTFTASADAGSIRGIIVQTDGKILLQGGFTSMDGVARDGLARVNSDGTLDTAFAPSLKANSYVDSIALQSNGEIVVGGNYFYYSPSGNYASVATVVRLNADGTADTTFTASISATAANGGEVDAIVVQTDGRIVIGGGFTAVSGATHNNVARLNSDGSVDATFTTGTDDFLNDVSLQSSGKILLTGRFTRVNGLGANAVARLNTDGTLDTTFAPDASIGLNASVRALGVQTDGKIVVGGIFTEVNGAAHSYIARLNPDGSLDGSFVAYTDGYVFGLAVQADGKILVTGSFANVDGAAHSYIARLNTDGTLDTTFATTVSYDVNAIALQTDGKIVIGGYFTKVNNVTHSYIARLNTDGSLDTTFMASTDTDGINSLAIQTDGKIVLGGNFTHVNSTARSYIARLNSTGTLDTTFTASTSSYVNNVALQSDGSIVMGGRFTTVNGATHNYLARLKTDGTLDTTFNTSLDSLAYNLVVQSDGKILFGGNFTQVNGTAHVAPARLNIDGSLDATFVTTTNGNGAVNAIVQQSDGKIVLGGSFTAVNGTIRNYLSRVNADGTLDTQFVPGAGSPKVAGITLQPTDGKVLVGGYFSAVAGQAANGLARLLTNGSLDTTFTAPFAVGDSVPAFVRQPADGNVVASQVPATIMSPIGALPQAVHPHAQTKVSNPIVRCNAINGSLDATFYIGAGTDGTAYALGLEADSANAGKIVVAGNFTQLNSVSGHTNLGRLNADGTLDASFIASANATVQTVLVQADGNLVVGGIFTQVDGVAHARIARLNAADGTLDTSFSTAITGGPVAALKQQSDGRLVVAGSFTTANSVACSCLARLNTDGTLDTTFNAGTISLGSGTALVSSVDQQTDGKLVIGGLFDHINGTARPNVARLNTDGSVDTTFDPGTGTNAIVNVLTLQPDGKTLLGGDFSTVDGVERDAAARLLGDYDLDDYPPLGQWRIINFNQPDNTGNAADTATPYGDGVPNLLKYALDLNPQGADATPMTATGTKGLPLVGKDSSGRYLTLTFVRRQAATTPGVSYNVEFANSLSNPSNFAVNPSATSEATTLDTTWERVTVTDSVPISTQALSRFVRLHITDP